MSRPTRLLTFAFFALLVTFGLQLTTSPPDPGIVPLELAFNKGEAQLLLDQWGVEGREAAKLNVWLDFFFIPAYVGFFLALIAFAMRDGQRWLLRSWSALPAMPITAGVLDVVENVFLLRILHDDGFSSAWVTVVSWSAAIKFVLLAIATVAVVGWVWIFRLDWFLSLGPIRWWRSVWNYVSDLVSLLWLCRASVLGLLGGITFLLFVPQGRDVIIGLADRPLGTRFGFFLAVAFWAVNIWFWARLMVRIHWDVTSKSGGRSHKADLMRKHLPRALGSAALIVVAFAFLKAGVQSPDGRAPYFRMTLWSAALALIFYGLTVARRPTMRAAHRSLRKLGPLQRGVQAKAIDLLDVEPSNELTTYGDNVPVEGSFVRSVTPLAVILIVFALSFFGIFSFSIEWSRRFGSAAVLLLSGGVWMPVGALLIYIATRFKLPVLGGLLVALFVFSFTNDNHAVRLLGKRSQPQDPPTVSTHFKEWLNRRGVSESSGQLHPVVVVAAEGGGIRAAYWTSTVLGRLQDQVPDFADHVYAISGVSGGSLGGAVFSSLVAEQRAGRDLDCAPNDQGRGPFETCADRMLRRDFLAPTIGSLLYSDLLQRFLPFPVAWFDRARALERSWEHAWSHLEGIDSSRFGGHGGASFDDLWMGASDPLEAWPSGPVENIYRVPLLILNTTSVETGKRVLISPLSIQQDEFTDAADFFEMAERKIRLSTAVHNSARFTYVSPAGTLKDQDGEVWGHLVDGGYFENSGATTALEILRAMRKAAGKRWSRLKPIVLMISNDPELGADTEPRGFLKEALSPIVALLHTRNARGSYSRQSLMDFFPDYSEACREERVHHVNLIGVRGVPLGWVLSADATEIMRAKAGSFVREIKGALDATTACP